MGEGRGPKPPAGGGGIQEANSGTDFSLFSRQHFGKGDSVVTTLIWRLSERKSLPEFAPENRVEGETSAHFLSARAQMGQQSGGVAAEFLHRVCQHGEAGGDEAAGWQLPLLVGRPCEAQRLGRPPGRIEGEGLEQVP